MSAWTALTKKWPFTKVKTSIVALAQGDNGFWVATQSPSFLIAWVSNQEGEHSLHNFLASNKSKDIRCSYLLEPLQYQMILIERPKVPQNELRAALRWKMAEWIDFPLHSAVMDYIEVPSKHGHPGMIYLVVSNRNDWIKSLKNIESTTLKMHAVAIPEMEIVSLFKKDTSSLCRVVLFQYQDKIRMLIVKNMMLLMMRSFEVSPDAQDSAHECALQIQRSLDYCGSHMMDTSKALIVLEPKLLGFKESFEKTLGLEVCELAPDFSNASDKPLDFMAYAALGAVRREFV